MVILQAALISVVIVATSVTARVIAAADYRLALPHHLKSDHGVAR
jgi:hypothetical protein